MTPVNASQVQEDRLLRQAKGSPRNDEREYFWIARTPVNASQVQEDRLLRQAKGPSRNDGRDYFGSQ